MKENEAEKIINNMGAELFEKYEDLNILGIYNDKNKSNSFGIEANIDISSDIGNSLTQFIEINGKRILKKKYNTHISKRRISKSIRVRKSSVFKPIHGTIMNPADSNVSIRNINNGAFNGKMSAIFEVGNFKARYLLTNQHVIGRLHMLNPRYEIIQKKKPLGSYDSIANYIDGKITSTSDFAIAEFSPKTPIKEPSGPKVVINSKVDCGDRLKVFNHKNNIVKLKYAMIRVTDPYFYRGGRLLEDQIIIDKRYVNGNSGAPVLSISTDKFVGILVASNSLYTAVNKSENIFNGIIKHIPIFNLQPNDFDQFNIYNLYT